MIWFYRLLFLPALLLALPYYLFRMWRRGGYGKSFQHRFGRIEPLGPVSPGKIRIWIQAVSVGEVLAVGPLVRILKQNPAIEIVLTTTTSTGYAEARRHYAEQTRLIGIFPLDFWRFSRCAWRRIQPSAIVLTESELWPEHLHQAKQKKVPAFLINARLSERSFRRYQVLRKPAARLLGKFSKIYTASSLDAERFLELGCEPSQIMRAGSIKFDVSVAERLSEAKRDQLRTGLGFGATSEQEPFVIVGASTWPGEESALLEAQIRLRERGIDCRLLLVPRHAERGDGIAQILEKQPLSWHQRSKRAESAAEIHIYLADTTGELAHLMQAGDLVFIGKSLPPNDGGQTPIEAAGLGLPMLLGPNMSNFREVTRSIMECHAARVVADSSELQAAIIQLHADPEARVQMRTSSLDWHATNRGSSQRIAEHLQKQLF